MQISDELVKYELENYLRLFNSFKDEDEVTQDDISGFIALSNQYLKMNLEKRALFLRKNLYLR